MPKSEKRLNKMMLMLTDTELQHIEDYRFSHRCENRSAALRELIRRGLARISA
jgi:hypothetical protein